jgi:large subunit ribosomal protein L19e
MQNLDKRKILASKVLGVGRHKIVFDVTRLAEIKEAITKQDIRDFYKEGIITIKEHRGRKTQVKRKTRRGEGKIKFTIKGGKKEYVILVRKLRRYISELRKQEKITPEIYQSLRRKIKSKAFRSKAHLRDNLNNIITGVKIK